MAGTPDDTARFAALDGLDGADRRAWTAEEVYRQHADFVWRSLHRLGVSDADLKDMCQEVFVVVHRRLDSFDGSSKMTSWLFGICLRVASMWRRHRRRHPEDPTDTPPEREDPRSPEGAYARRQAAVTLQRALDALSPEKRAVFVMFEVESIPCARVADELGVPVGTVYSRLHAARAEFLAALEEIRKGQGGRP